MIKSKRDFEKLLKETVDNIVDNFSKQHILKIVDYDLNNPEDSVYIGNVANKIWQILEQAYAPLGGFKSFKDTKDMLKKANQITLGFADEEIVAVSVYNDYLGGNKEVGIAAVKGEKHSYGVQLVEQIIQRNIQLWDNWYWVDASSRVEELYLKNNGTPILNVYVPSIFPNKTIRLNNDEFHYHREIGGEQIESEKMMFGFKDEQLKKQIERDFPLGFTDKIEAIKKRILKEEKFNSQITQLEASKYIVDMFIDAYNDGVRQISVGLLLELKKNLIILQEHIEKGLCPKNRTRAINFAIEDGYDALTSFKPLKLFSIKDIYKQISF